MINHVSRELLSIVQKTFMTAYPNERFYCGVDGGRRGLIGIFDYYQGKRLAVHKSKKFVDEESINAI